MLGVALAGDYSRGVFRMVISITVCFIQLCPCAAPFSAARLHVDMASNLICQDGDCPYQQGAPACRQTELPIFLWARTHRRPSPGLLSTRQEAPERAPSVLFCRHSVGLSVWLVAFTHSTHCRQRRPN